MMSSSLRGPGKEKLSSLACDTRAALTPVAAAMVFTTAGTPECGLAAARDRSSSVLPGTSTEEEEDHAIGYLVTGLDVTEAQVQQQNACAPS